MCVHVFLLPSIQAAVIPGEDPESRDRFDTLEFRSTLHAPRFRGDKFSGEEFGGNDIEGKFRLSLPCTRRLSDQQAVPRAWFVWNEL